MIFRLTSISVNPFIETISLRPYTPCIEETFLLDIWIFWSVCLRFLKSWNAFSLLVVVCVSSVNDFMDIIVESMSIVKPITFHHSDIVHMKPRHEKSHPMRSTTRSRRKVHSRSSDSDVFVTPSSNIKSGSSKLQNENSLLIQLFRCG